MHTWNQPIFDSLVARLERLPHALLLFGPRGVGKLALAERVSQLLLCEGTGKKPSDACDACIAAAKTEPVVSLTTAMAALYARNTQLRITMTRQ